MSLFFFGQQRYGAGGSLSSPVSGLSRRRSSHFPSGIVAATISDPAAIMSTMTIRPRARTPRSALIERASSGVQRSEGSAVAAHVWLATMVRLRAAGLQLLLLRTLRHTQEANGASAKIRKRCAGGGIPAQRLQIQGRPTTTKSRELSKIPPPGAIPVNVEHVYVQKKRLRRKGRERSGRPCRQSRISAEVRVRGRANFSQRGNMYTH